MSQTYSHGLSARSAVVRDARSYTLGCLQKLGLAPLSLGRCAAVVGWFPPAGRGLELGTQDSGPPKQVLCSRLGMSPPLIRGIAVGMRDLGVAQVRSSALTPLNFVVGVHRVSVDERTTNAASSTAVYKL